jgi:hypothetical protein
MEYYEILFGLKEGDVAIHDNMDRARGYYVK